MNINHIKIRQIRLEDVDSVAKIHTDAFQGFFLTSLGIRFLRLYYSCFIRSDETVSLCAEMDGKVVGFSAATKTSNGFNGRLVKSNIVSFGLLALHLCFSSPRSLVRLIKNFSKKSDLVEDSEDYAELYSIGVQSCAQGMGVGKLLLSETETIMYGGGVKQLSLTTDKENNEQAVCFYRSLGYNVLYEFKAYPNRWMYRLIKELSPS